MNISERTFYNVQKWPNKKMVVTYNRQHKMDNNKYTFNEKEPEPGAYICIYWKDGSECECIYDGLDASLTPLPTH